MTLYQTTRFHSDLLKLKAFPGKLDVTRMINILTERVENIVGLGKNADYQHFLLSARCF